MSGRSSRARDDGCGVSRRCRSRPSTPSTRAILRLAIHHIRRRGPILEDRPDRTYEPDLPNLRQVHLMHEELFDELALKGYDVSAGQLGENITTRDVDLLGLPTGALLRLGDQAVLEVTGLRNPCSKINDFRPGLLGEVFALDPVSGEFTFKSGIMAVVRQGGTVRPNDPVQVELPPLPHHPLERV
ncbi:MOSC domain-containing protein [Streptomyces sp. JL2001]|uniref:MOSC domain-containing protein n=1 Tax=Streptomyces sp. JL2001 TaxID=3342488 RepID=UPI003D808F40